MARNARESISGFTLIEVLLTVSLIALLSTLLVLNIGSLLRDGTLETMENEYWRAVDAARTKAVFRQSPYFIHWDEKEQAFVVTSADDVQRFAVDTSSFEGAELEVFFEEVAPENSYVLIRGELVRKREIGSVAFYPDGTCSPYVVTLRVADFETTFQMDPWTGAQLVGPAEDEA